MKLTRKQRNLIDKYTNASPAEIAKKLGLNPDAVATYLNRSQVLVYDPQNKLSGEQTEAFPGSLREFILKFINGNKNKLLFLVLLTTVIYLSSLPNAAVSDDKPLMGILNSAKYMEAITKEPVNALLNSLTYSLNYLVHGTKPLGYHLVNLALHLLVSLSVFFFLCLITNQKIAFLTSLIYATNTLHTEAVDWISGRHYILYSFFGLTSLMLYIYYTTVKNKRIYYFFSVLLFISSVYSFPEQAIVLPLFLPLIDLYKGNLRKNFRLYAVYFFLSLIFVLLSLNRVQDRVISVAGDALVSQNNGLAFILTDVIAIFSYLKLFIIPFGLSFYHESVSMSGLSIILYFLVSVVFVLLLPIIFFKRSKLVAFAVGFFVIALLPTLTPLKVSWVVAERYAYLGSLGLSLLVATLFNYLFRSRFRKISILTFVSLISFWSILTFQRGFDWKDEDSLWLATAKTSPDSSKAQNNMGDYYGRHGDMQASFNAFIRATQINPTYSDAWHNAGNTLVQMGKYDESIPYFEKSLEFNPSLIEAYNNLALVYHKKGDGQKASDMINKSLQINPYAAKTYSMWAFIEYENKNIDKAKEALQKGLAIDPKNQALLQNLAILEKSQTQPQR